MNLNSSLRPPLPTSYVAEVRKTCAALRNAQNIDVSGLFVIRSQVFPIRGCRRTKATFQSSIKAVYFVAIDAAQRQSRQTTLTRLSSRLNHRLSPS